ncbi:MAG TPA: bifunctional methylenetetrahydrofolate dehydrogenase/methenyltetrahydrofolate cyclohydrolase FolD [Croceibacterium sp.]|nr:bifunctional methylenetetrahydrofolate dehydrogenase/methenyltetrahydrofolate cyclohydrolase FolD [Croceibacterium sp.]
MSAKVIDGKAFAARLRDRIAEYARDFEGKAGRKAGLAVILVGEDPASEVYVRSKARATLEAGMASFEFKLPAETSESELLARVKDLNASPAADGILVQLPLPSHMDERKVIATIDPDKDVDGFHVVNAGRLCIGLHGFVPCTPLGCLMLLKDQLGDLSGLEAVVLGRSNIVGRPMAQLLVDADCTVTIAHSRTRNLPDVVRRGDIVVAAVGKPQMVRGSWIKPGATVLDVGINRVEGEDGKTRLVGDVAYDEASKVAGAITPVPGGVGPMTIAVLLRNTIVSAYRRERLELAKDSL